MLIRQVRKELRRNVDREYRNGAKRYFKEGIELYGVRSHLVRDISARYFSEVRGESKQEIFKLCEKFLKSGMSEEKAIAFDWAYRLRKSYEKSDFKRFESWLRNYVSNWAACDDHCCHAFGSFIFQFPEFFPRLTVWAHSTNRWFRRASSVVLIYSLRKSKMLSKAFKIADILLMDEDDLVQKGYGWMLKEASNQYPERVFKYVMRHRDRMPRTALRYAIEKLSPRLKKRAMKRA